LEGATPDEVTPRTGERANTSVLAFAAQNQGKTREFYWTLKKNSPREGGLFFNFLLKILEARTGIEPV
jgi:hypothetical protein